MPKKQSSPENKVFVVTSKTAIITENEKTKRPVIEETVKTYSIKRTQPTKATLYELDRKKPPRRIKTFNLNSKVSINSIISDIQSNKRFIKTKNLTKRRTFKTVIIDGKPKREYTGTSNIVQSNYKARVTLRSKGTTIRIRPQLVGLVRIKDRNTDVEDYFVGYSSKTQSSRPSINAVNTARQEVKEMALAKYMQAYHSNSYATAHYKESFNKYEIEITEERYQYWETNRFI